MNKRLLGMVFALTAGVGVTGCGDSRPAPNTSSPPAMGQYAQPPMNGVTAEADTTAGPKQNTSTASPAPQPAATGDTREEIMKTMQEKFDALQADISALEKRVEAGTDALKARFKNEWEPELRRKQDAMKAQLARAKAATEAEWAQFKQDLQGAMDDFGKFYDRMVEGTK